MPSFDVVSQVNLQEVDNAVNQAMKEVQTRFDFKGSGACATFDQEGLHLVASDEYKIKALIDVVQEKLVKRGVSLKAFRFGEPEPSLGGSVKCRATVIQGIDHDHAREIFKVVKDSGLKVQSQIMGDRLRVSGKKKDDLQAAMALIRGREWPLPLQFTNLRD